MKISDNFTLEEFEHSQTALQKNIDNSIPNDLQYKIVRLVCEILQPLRNNLKSSVHITSGYRCNELNKTIGGAKNSQHEKAEACDFVCSNNAKAFNWIKNNCYFDQLIWEFGDNDQPKWVHVSYNSTGKQRRQILKAYKQDGKTKYGYLMG